jgi:hypothetical protein
MTDLTVVRSGGLQLLRRSTHKKIVTLPSGERVQVTVEGTEMDGFVEHTEHKDGRVDGSAYPTTIHYKFGKDFE